MKRPGRRYPHQVGTYVDEPTLMWLYESANAQEVSLSTLLRALIATAKEVHDDGH
jgi:hypothetical protein